MRKRTPQHELDAKNAAIKRERRAAVTELINRKKITRFGQIFESGLLPKNYLVVDFGFNNTTATKVIKDPSNLNYSDTIKLAKYFNIPTARMALLIINQIEATAI